LKTNPLSTGGTLLKAEETSLDFTVESFRNKNTTRKY
jgi:hypothetical protein